MPAEMHQNSAQGPDQTDSNSHGWTYVDIRCVVLCCDCVWQDIRPNDFMLAMLVRLGRLDPEDMTKCRRLFSKLDRDCSGTLNEYDIQALLASAPDTSFISDATFDTFQHEVIDPAARPIAAGRRMNSIGREGATGEWVRDADVMDEQGATTFEQD